MTLVEFLTQRLDEDEKSAAMHTQPRGEITCPVCGGPAVIVASSYSSYMGGEHAIMLDHLGSFASCVVRNKDAAAFIGSWPLSKESARALREVAAKRAIIAVVQAWGHEHNDEDSWYSCSQAIDPYDGSWQCANDNRVGQPCDCGLEARRAKILGPLAAIHADHPDYQQEWKGTK